MGKEKVQDFLKNLRVTQLESFKKSLGTLQSPGLTPLMNRGARQDAYAYLTFLAMLKGRNLPTVDKKQFKTIVAPLVEEQFDVCLRNDLPALSGEGLRGWKGLRMQSVRALN